MRKHEIAHAHVRVHVRECVMMMMMMMMELVAEMKGEGEQEQDRKEKGREDAKTSHGVVVGVLMLVYVHPDYNNNHHEHLLNAGIYSLLCFWGHDCQFTSMTSQTASMTLSQTMVTCCHTASCKRSAIVQCKARNVFQHLSLMAVRVKSLATGLSSS